MLQFDTEIRTEIGTGASRRLRLQNKIPVILYGNSQPPVALTLSHDAINKASQHNEFYSAELQLVVHGVVVRVKLHDIQRHPFKPRLLHLDFLRVN